MDKLGIIISEKKMLEKLDTESKGSKSSKATERREKFVALAENRTKNAIKAVRVIAKLGNKNAYEYTEADVKKIAAALNREIDALKARMLSSGGKEAVDFKL
jgi:ribosomal protein L7/L12